MKCGRSASVVGDAATSVVVTDIVFIVISDSVMTLIFMRNYRFNSLPKIDMKVLEEVVKTYPDGYQYERAARLGVSQRAIGDALKRLTVSAIKKTLSHPKTDEHARRIFQDKIKAYQTAKQPIVYLDESGLACDMPHTHGYAPIGERCFGKHDWHAKGRTNVIGALLASTLLTVTLFTGTINDDVFFAWLW